MRRLVLLSVLFLAFVVPAYGQLQPLKSKPTKITQSVWRPSVKHPDKGHFVHFVKRAKMLSKDQGKLLKLDAKSAALPIDWAKNYDFPMDLNDQLGSCYYAAGCHADNTWTANVGIQSFFSLSAIRARYFALSGGDNGLYDADMQGEMLGRGLADVPAAKILDWIALDTTHPPTVQTVMQNFGIIMFTMAVPDAWIDDSDTGSVWDVPATANPNNGHAVLLNGCRTDGAYQLITWGTGVWITPAGVNACDPAGWACFSARWFSPSTGRAPNGKHIIELATLWKTWTGKTIPASVIASFPPDTLTPPVITSAKTKTVQQGKPFVYQITANGVYNPQSFTATGLPIGLTCSPVGVIAGTPIAAGSFSVKLGVGGSNGVGTGTLALSVTPSVPPPPPPTSSGTITISFPGQPDVVYSITKKGTLSVDPAELNSLREVLDRLFPSIP